MSMSRDTVLRAGIVVVVAAAVCYAMFTVTAALHQRQHADDQRFGEATRELGAIGACERAYVVAHHEPPVEARTALLTRSGGLDTALAARIGYHAPSSPCAFDYYLEPKGGASAFSVDGTGPSVHVDPKGQLIWAHIPHP